MLVNFSFRSLFILYYLHCTLFFFNVCRVDHALKYCSSISLPLTLLRSYLSVRLNNFSLSLMYWPFFDILTLSVIYHRFCASLYECWPGWGPRDAFEVIKKLYKCWTEHFFFLCDILTSSVIYHHCFVFMNVVWVGFQEMPAPQELSKIWQD